MNQRSRDRVTAADVLSRYNDEQHPDFGEPLTNVNQAGSIGNRPIHLATHRGNLEDIVALVEGGADVNVAGDMGYTPMHEAAGSGHIEIVKFLLIHGAYPDVENEFGMTPLDLAMRKGYADIVELLKGASAK